jgi:prepilin-type processing-associated H-X9-DG protein
VQFGTISDTHAGVLQQMDFGAISARFGYGTVAIHRARLAAVLGSALTPDVLQTGKTCVQIESHANGVQVQFADGSVAEGDLLIGADGARSAVRRTLFPNIQLRYSGQSSYRGVLHYTLPPELAVAGREIWSAGCRFGFSNIGHGEVYWYATFDTPPGVQTSHAENLAHVRRMAEAFPAPVPALSAATPEDAILRTDMYDLPPLPAWHQGRIALLGDAAHATTPNLGQGGAQAIEDAYVLAHMLATQPSIEAAFAAYEQIRRAKALHVVATSRQLGSIVHIGNPLLRTMRNMILRNVPPAVAVRQWEALYNLNY